MGVWMRCERHAVSTQKDPKGFRGGCVKTIFAFVGSTGGNTGRLVAAKEVRAANGYEKAESRTIFRGLVRHSGKVAITQDEITVRLRSRAKVHYLLAAGYPQMEERVPWLGNKLLRIQFA